MKGITMDAIQIIVVLAIICMIGGAGMILGSGVQPKKTKVNPMLDATPVVYIPHSIDHSTRVIEMVVTGPVKK